jgi:hypothetical protein
MGCDYAFDWYECNVINWLNIIGERVNLMNDDLINVFALSKRYGALIIY